MNENTLNQQDIEDLFGFDLKDLSEAIFNAVVDTYHRFLWKGPDQTVVARNRIAFLFEKHVVKIPRCQDGLFDNDWEGSVRNNEESLGHPYYVQYPRTRLFYWKDVPILFMERVEPVNWKEKLKSIGDFEFPDWVNSVDCGQVGYTRDGRLVAYDYGLR